MGKLKASIIGCGRVSYKHIDALVDNYSRMELISVCDIYPNRMDYLIDYYYNKIDDKNKSLLKINKYVDYIEMLEKEDADIVIITTANGYHAKHALDSLNRGKHVLVEKPLALSIEDADSMILSAKKNNVKLGVCYQQRFNPVIQKVKRAIDEGRFGRLVNVTGRILWNRNDEYYKQASWRGTKRLDGGMLLNQCIHNIDLIQWLIGSEIDSICAEMDTFLHDIETEDFGAIIIRFKNRTIGIVEGSVCVYPKNLGETLSIFGEKGTVVIGDGMNKIKVWRFEDELGENIGVSGTQGHSLLYEDFIDAIKNNREPFINGEEGKKSIEIALGAYISQKEGKKVKLPIKGMDVV